MFSALVERVTLSGVMATGGVSCAVTPRIAPGHQ